MDFNGMAMIKLIGYQNQLPDGFSISTKTVINLNL